MIIQPMTECYIHLDCLHDGPVDLSSPPSRKPELWQSAPNLPPHPWSDEVLIDVARQYDHISEGWRGEPSLEFMREMISRYGTCAILAWTERRVVGQLRFYPLDIAQLLASADPMKQSAPAFSAFRFQPDACTLWVQCVMTTKPYLTVEEARQVHARMGVGQALVRGLITWARERDWQRVVKYAHADIVAMYGQYGGGGKAFWEKAGFQVIGRYPDERVEEWITQSPEWRTIVESQAQRQGIPIKDVWTWYAMAYNL
jgi:GNAT superfamily N-acetyltransferase